MYKYFFKRLFDIVVSLIALPFFLLIFIVLAPIIWLTDGGPVFYVAPRLGKKGKVFNMYKFRSMKVNSPNLLNADGSTYNGANDPRVTKIGKFMRKTSLDEIPQILNILFGHMSLIGPRAHLTTNYKGYDLLDDVRKRRLDVRPGITGYNQAYFRNSATSEEKLKNDVYYVENLSFWMDVKVFFKTIATVLKSDNVYVKAEAPVAVATVDANGESHTTVVASAEEAIAEISAEKTEAVETAGVSE
ncbi:MAG: sugar transferase [Clostridia bacterium]|nr:sugar transferase [Clostridia bacterium]